MAKQLKKDLLNELELLLEPEVSNIFLDIDDIRVGDTLDTQIVQTLKQSVCMLCLWTPNYFSREHPYSAREYRTMEIIEQRRFEQIGINEISHRLIIPLTLRYSKKFPSSKLNDRLYINFEEFLRPRDGGLTREREYFEKISQIAEYIAERYWELNQISEENLELSYIKDNLIPEEEFKLWLDSILV